MVNRLVALLLVSCLAVDSGWAFCPSSPQPPPAIELRSQHPALSAKGTGDVLFEKQALALRARFSGTAIIGPVGHSILEATEAPIVLVSGPPTTRHSNIGPTISPINYIDPFCRFVTLEFWCCLSFLI